jgi:hypothetical protein
MRFETIEDLCSSMGRMPRTLIQGFIELNGVIA